MPCPHVGQGACEQCWTEQSLRLEASQDALAEAQNLSDDWRRGVEAANRISQRFDAEAQVLREDNRKLRERAQLAILEQERLRKALRAKLTLILSGPKGEA